jgi:hypothetical protein
MRRVETAPLPSEVCIAVHVHRICCAEKELADAYAGLSVARANARSAGISPRALKAAIAALKRGGPPSLSPAAQAIVDAVRAVPIGDVETAAEGGALFATR